MKSKIKWLLAIWLGKRRMFWGLCPLCNSDAPELYDCPVCEFNKVDRSVWLPRYRAAIDGNYTVGRLVEKSRHNP